MERSDATVIGVHSTGYKILRSLFKHLTTSEFPIAFDSECQDNLEMLYFCSPGVEMEIVMNIGHLREKKLPVTVRYRSRRSSPGYDKFYDGDLLVDVFLQELEPLLKKFRRLQDEIVILPSTVFDVRFTGFTSNTSASFQNEQDQLKLSRQEVAENHQ